MEGLDHPLRWWGIHNGTADSWGLCFRVWLKPYLGDFVNVLVGLRAEVQGLDHPLGWGGIHNGTADNLGHVPVVICQVHLHVLLLLELSNDSYVLVQPIIYVYICIYSHIHTYIYTCMLHTQHVV